MMRVDRLAKGNAGDSRFLRDISEMRIDYGPGIEFIIETPAGKLLSCFVAEISVPSKMTLREREKSLWLINRRNNMKAKKEEQIIFTKYDPAEYIETKEDVIALLEVAIEENDPDFLLSIIENSAHSKGMSQIARELGVSRKGLYKSLAPDGNPSFKTVFKLFDILGLRLRIEPKSA